MEQAIVVAPCAEGWVVKSAAFENEMFFHSGESAELTARELAAKMAQADAPVMIEIFLRDGALGGRYVHTGRSWRSL